MPIVLSRRSGGGGGGPGTLPDWWTVDSTPGAESFGIAGAVEIDPGRDVSALVLRAIPGQTEHVMRAYNDDGDLVLDLDAAGILDVSRFAVNPIPVDVGGAPGTSTSQVAPSVWKINSGTDASENPLQIKRWDGVGAFASAFTVGRTGAIVRTGPLTTASNETSWEITASADTTGNAIEMWDNDFNNMLFSVSYTGAITATLPTANPGPGGLWNDGGTVKVGT